MKVAAIGECMMEFRRGDDGRYDLAYGGDTFNTAVYLRRLGIPVDYVTALGGDAFSDDIIDLCRNEGVGTAHIARVPNRLPGLYLITTDAAGERTFFYWRDRSPAREIFELAAVSDVVDALRRYDLIYLSGITLSLYSERGLTILFSALDRARALGGRVAFDGNYRPTGWPDAAAARAVFDAMVGRVDIILPTFDDERLLYRDPDAERCARRYRDSGVAEVVVKDGSRGCLVAVAGETRLVGVETVVGPVDTTAAGDSFNAGYLAARLGGAPPEAAARVGHRLAGAVIQHPGAIIPPDAMPVMNDLMPPPTGETAP